MFALACSLFVPFFQEPGQLPESWFGLWKGTIRIDGVARPSQSVDMSLEVTAIPKSSRVNWILMYVAQGKTDVRKYELALVPDQPGRFLMDERNGIVLDHSLVGNTLSSLFQVQNTLLHVSFQLEKDTMRVTMSSYDAQAVRESGATTQETKVSSYPLKSVQQGTLRRIRSKGKTSLDVVHCG